MINLFISFGSFFQNRLAKLFQKLIKTEKNLENSHERTLKILNFLIWIIIGIIGILLLENLFSLGTLFVFLAFRSGATLSKRFIFGIHDIKVMKNNLSEGKITKIISRIVEITIFTELLYLLAWAIFYRALNTSVKTIFEIEGSIFILSIWLIGLLYGIIFSLIQTIFSKGFLLKNEIGIALLVSGELFKNKISETKDSIQNRFKL
ncbi:MAG: hypothetical protein EU543_04015 [Promethearchaeota archaeon]|nr:MAG: hypothetical protein EU543_04015 [Candidatus Lokiarchaeota archaeon]